MSTTAHNIDLKTCGTRLQGSISIFIPHVIIHLQKATTPHRKPPPPPPFHVVAVDGETSGSKMLIDLTGSAAMLGAVI